MAKPVIVVVDDEDDSLAALTHELESRYGAHYLVVACASPGQALARLAGLRAEGASVPLVLADQWMPETTGAEFLAQVRDLYPTAHRVLLIAWGDQAAAAPVADAAALGQIEFCVPKPAWSPDERFHRAVTESLEEWWRQQGGRFEAVTVIGKDPSARVHEIRDLLSRNSVPFGFLPSDSRRAGPRWRAWAWPGPPGRWWRSTPAPCWWTRPTPRWPKRWEMPSGRPGLPMTW